MPYALALQFSGAESGSTPLQAREPLSRFGTAFHAVTSKHSVKMPFTVELFVAVISTVSEVVIPRSSTLLWYELPALAQVIRHDSLSPVAD